MVFTVKLSRDGIARDAIDGVSAVDLSTPSRHFRWIEPSNTAATGFHCVSVKSLG
jgi:hypothetical protein